MTARDELIEVMARGMCAGDQAAAGGPEAWEAVGPTVREWYLSYARYALAAIKAEHGEVMVEVAPTCHVPSCHCGPRLRRRLITLWTTTPTSRGTSS